MSEGKNPMHKIEDIKRKLYERENHSFDHHKEGILHEEKHDVSLEWDQGSTVVKKPKNSSIFKTFFTLAVIFFLGSLVFAGFKYIKGGSVVSSENIEINVIGNAFTQGGELLPLQIEIINNNNASLELVNMIVEYPKGATLDPSDIVRLPRESIGTISPGERVERNVDIVLFGDQNVVRDVTIKLEYHPEGSNAIFTKEKIYPVTINSSPVALSFFGPDQTSSNQELNFRIVATLNTTLPSEQAVLKVEYPNGFRYEGADIDPSLGDSIWSLEDLSTTSPLVLNIKGRLVGQDNDEQVFRAYIGTIRSNNQSSVDVVYNSVLHSVAINKPFLETRIVINGEDGEYYAAQGGKEIKANIVWSNNLPNKVDNVEIIARLSGNVLDKSNITSDGFYNSADNTITWDRNVDDIFGSVEPGANGNVTFSFKPLSVIGSGSSVRDPQVIIEVSIRGREPSSGIGFSEVNNFEKKVVKILSDFQIAANAFHSSGPKPPKAESTTFYNVVWTLSNSVNTITNAEARASLPVYIKWVGSGSKDVTFDEVSKEVVWNIGTVKPNTGFGSVEKEVSFNVSITPSLSQVGSVPLLVQGINLSGKDAFTEKIIKSSQRSVSTLTQNDPDFSSGDERVIQ